MQKFNIEKDALNQFWIQDSFGNLVEGPLSSITDARQVVESLTFTFERNACAWNGHDLNDEKTVKVENKFTTDEVCQTHQGLYVKSVAALASDNPTVRGVS